MFWKAWCFMTSHVFSLLFMLIIIYFKIKVYLNNNNNNNECIYFYFYSHALLLPTVVSTEFWIFKQFIFCAAISAVNLLLIKAKTESFVATNIQAVNRVVKLMSKLPGGTLLMSTKAFLALTSNTKYPLPAKTRKAKMSFGKLMKLSLTLKFALSAILIDFECLNFK